MYMYTSVLTALFTYSPNTCATYIYIYIYIYICTFVVGIDSSHRTYCMHVSFSTKSRRVEEWQSSRVL